MIIFMVLLLCIVFAVVYKKEINNMFFNRFTPEELEAYQESVILHMEELHERQKQEIKDLVASERRVLTKLIDELKAVNREALQNKAILKEYSEEIDYKINKYENYINVFKKRGD